MEAKFWRIAASLGVPGFALAVFYKLYDKFDWPLKEIPPDRMFILVVVFMVIIAVIVILALVIYRPKATNAEHLVHKYDRLREGLATPEQNVLLIEELANSKDPNKEKYLQEFQDFKNISHFEVQATKKALVGLRSSKAVSGLFRVATEEERKNLTKMAGATGDQLLDAAIVGLKYWRFLNRRNHPQFAEIEQAIGNSLTFQNPEQIVAALKKIQLPT